MKYMMFVVVDPDAEATPREEDITIEEWLGRRRGPRHADHR